MGEGTRSFGGIGGRIRLNVENTHFPELKTEIFSVCP